MRNTSTTQFQCKTSFGVSPWINAVATEDEFVSKDYFPKTQKLAYSISGSCNHQKNKSTVLSNETYNYMISYPSSRLHMHKEVVTQEDCRDCVELMKRSYRPEFSPAWLKHERETLCFYCYLQQPVHYSYLENYRLRYFLLFFFLEDSTMQIFEPQINNSGIDQGLFLQRHKFPKSRGDEFYGVKHLQIGMSVEVYGRAFRIVDCDGFTRWFYKKIGLELESPEELFDDKVIRTSEMKSTNKSLETKEAAPYSTTLMRENGHKKELKQYLENDGKILRFYCYWEDMSEYGRRRYYILRYFLAGITTMPSHKELRKIFK